MNQSTFSFNSSVDDQNQQMETPEPGSAENMHKWLKIYKATVHNPLFNESSGLFKSTEDLNHAWIRENVYGSFLLFYLHKACLKFSTDDDLIEEASELKNLLIKNVRAVLKCIASQTSKINNFLAQSLPKYAIHAKFSSDDFSEVVGDEDWGHLQLDSISLYLILLARLYIEGIYVILSEDEFILVQSLVFYIEKAFQIPDYGIWERGNKLNTGIPELNSSSIGMAKAALEYLDMSDFCYTYGTDKKRLFILTDSIGSCECVLSAMLPKESRSKEIDASLLMLVGFPSFVVKNNNKSEEWVQKLKDDLLGKYGCKRFLRDGYMSPTEEMTRLYYNFEELITFDKIESEWPMFLGFLAINSYVNNDIKGSEVFLNQMNSLVVNSLERGPILPKMYIVKKENVKAAKFLPTNAKRVPVSIKSHLWTQSIFIIANLLNEKMISSVEIYPMQFRYELKAQIKPPIKMVVFAENSKVQSILARYGLKVERLNDLKAFNLMPSRILPLIIGQIGKSENLGLTSNREIILFGSAHSRLYKFNDKLYYFTSQAYDYYNNYIMNDAMFSIEAIRQRMAYLNQYWMESRPPIVIFVVKKAMLENSTKLTNNLFGILEKMFTGYIDGLKIKVCDSESAASEGFIENLEESHSVTMQMGEIVTNEHDTITTEDAETIGDYSFNLPKDSVMSMAQNSLSNADLTSTANTSSNNAVKLIRRNSIDTTSIFETTENMIDECEKLEYLYENFQNTTNLCKKADILNEIITSDDYDLEKFEKITNVNPNNLIKEIMTQALNAKNWIIIRNFGFYVIESDGLLEFALTNILMNQKILTLGWIESEIQIVDLKTSSELRMMIKQHSRNSTILASLTEEFIIYLSMFFVEMAQGRLERRKPHLYKFLKNTLNIKITALIQVCLIHLENSMKINPEKAAMEILKKSPYDLKNLLYSILSANSDEEIPINGNMPTSCENGDGTCEPEMIKKSLAIRRKSSIDIDEQFDDSSKEDHRIKLWRWRRKIDGLLSRVPENFHLDIYNTLKHINSIVIGRYSLGHNLVKCMTSNELSFSIMVEDGIGSLQSDELRQLCVEVMIILSRLVQLVTERYSELLPKCQYLTIDILQVCLKAQEFYFQSNGFETPNKCPHSTSKSDFCGTNSICKDFTSLAPSGSGGTLSFITKSLIQIIF